MKKLFCVFTLFILLSLCSCSYNNMEYENNQLKSQVKQLEKELGEKSKEIAELKNANKTFTINYMQNTNSKRFIEKQCSLLALPVDSSIIMRTISENTVVTVIDTAEVNSTIWLYISIPVYDSPSNYKGWIRESDSVPYTEEMKSKVQSDVTVKKGECVYETYDFADIKSTTPYIAEYEEHGRIIERCEGYLQLSCPGGKTIWVKDTSVIYPPIE